MQLLDDKLWFSPSDISAFLACQHLTRLDLAVVRGSLAKPVLENPEADLIKRKGDEHEASYLAKLHESGLRVEEVAFDFDWAAAVEATSDALRAGVDVVYQACFAHDGWRGFAD